jgi:hypothetical protein
MRSFTMPLLTLVLTACAGSKSPNDEASTSSSSSTTSTNTSSAFVAPQPSSTGNVSPTVQPPEQSTSTSATSSGPASSDASATDSNAEFGSTAPPSQPSVEPQQTCEPLDASTAPQPNNQTDSDATSSATPVAMEGCEDGPLGLPLEGCSPEFEETGDFYADCVARINQLRWECQCLPPLERWTEAEDCADQQAQYDYEVDEAHAGIGADICEPGGGSQNECPGYGPSFGIVDFCLQQMWDEGPGEDFQAHGHYINMSSQTVTRVACGRYETPEGDIWSVQNFSR